MAEVLKDLTTKKQVEHALDLGDQHEEKRKKIKNFWFKLPYWLKLLWRRITTLFNISTSFKYFQFLSDTVYKIFG